MMGHGPTNGFQLCEPWALSSASTIFFARPGSTRKHNIQCSQDVQQPSTQYNTYKQKSPVNRTRYICAATVDCMPCTDGWYATWGACTHQGCT